MWETLYANRNLASPMPMQKLTLMMAVVIWNKCLAPELFIARKKASRLQIRQDFLARVISKRSREPLRNISHGPVETLFPSFPSSLTWSTLRIGRAFQGSKIPTTIVIENGLDTVALCLIQREMF